MRAHVRRRARESEEESVFVSMTDMTISFLIILMILLAFFASRFTDEEMVPRPDLVAEQLKAERLERQLDELKRLLAAMVPREQLFTEQRRALQLQHHIDELKRQLAALRRPDPLEAYLRDVALSRKTALAELQRKIRVEFPDLDVVTSAENDALRFQGEGLFAHASDRLERNKLSIVERVAELLDELLPCYSVGPRSNHDLVCNPGYAVVEAVQIEGHTDAVGEDDYNMKLASNRAISTYAAMTNRAPRLFDHKNLRGEPGLSVAGYGENRPVADNETPQGRATNRRIDLRFIMYAPNQSEEIAGIREKLKQRRIDVRSAE